MARATVGTAKASLQRTEMLLSYSRLLAPFAGVVTARHVDPGAFVPSATGGSAASSAAVVTVMDFDIIRAEVPIPETEAALVRVGQPVQITTLGLSGRDFTGQVSRVSYALDEATRTMRIEADLPNPQRELRPGMFATVKVGVEKHNDALRVPAAAVTREKANAFVFVADQGKAKKTAIKTGFNDGSRVEVLDGLAADAQVLLPGKTPLADGQPVSVKEGP
jgi:membrane fusion protein (multidrug efflux system)